MRRLILAIAAMAAIFMGAATPVAASAASHHGTPRSGVTCSESWTGFVGPPGNASVAWRLNSCGHQVRVEIFCNGGSFPQFLFGGWVRTVGLHSGKTCPASEPNLVSAYAQTRDGPGGAVTTTQFF